MSKMINILLVANSNHYSLAIKAFLEPIGYRVVLLEHMNQVIPVLAREDIDLILVDLELHFGKGFLVNALIREQPRFQHIPIVMITDNSNDEALVKSFESGAIDCIRKPLNQIELLARIKNVLQTTHHQSCLKRMYNTLRDDIKTAAEIQQLFLPKNKQYCESYCFDFNFQPFLLVSGDIFDCIEIDPYTLVYYIGDISGHGMKSALLMTSIKTYLNSLLEKAEVIEPWNIIYQLNQKMARSFGDNYLTLLFCVIDLEQLQATFYNAGHPPPFLVREGKTEILEGAGGIPVGWSLDFDYSARDQMEISLEPFDQLIFYTDGLFENENNPNIKGYKSLKTVVEQYQSLPFYQFCSTVLDDLNRKNLKHVSDDYSMMLLKLNGKPETLRIRITPHLDNVPGAASQVNIFLFEETRNSRLTNEVEIVMTEFVNNIIVHGYQNQPQEDTFIGIELKLFKDYLQFLITDTASPWNWPKKIKPLESIDPFTLSGRGLPIIHSIFDEIHIKHYGAENIAILRKYL